MKIYSIALASLPLVFCFTSCKNTTKKTSDSTEDTSAENQSDENMNWCSEAETYGGDIQKQYADGNYAEVWFKTASISVSDAAVSNEDYFTKND